MNLREKVQLPQGHRVVFQRGIFCIAFPSRMSLVVPNVQREIRPSSLQLVLDGSYFRFFPRQVVGTIVESANAWSVAPRAKSVDLVNTPKPQSTYRSGLLRQLLTEYLANPWTNDFIQRRSPSSLTTSAQDATYALWAGRSGNQCLPAFLVIMEQYQPY